MYRRGYCAFFIRLQNDDFTAYVCMCGPIYVYHTLSSSLDHLLIRLDQDRMMHRLGEVSKSNSWIRYYVRKLLFMKNKILYLYYTFQVGVDSQIFLANIIIKICTE